ncbi:outer membrane protein TolC [Chryseobacterium rhizosphaerae]|uniref:TolC family protein n=1 Tax=Chryseobacterium rhizosphaerae TaxID=395937 RepID=UPI0028585B0F|nr:TolC family protein [Chryseobacterium rhizosphaerae]MDR6547754.1 outer membrane protein TolC [Chryseobacterium rhizosphaerae]
MNLSFRALILWLGCPALSFAQLTSLEDVLLRAEKNYQSIKKKEINIQASQERLQLQKTYYLPEVTLMAQQSFGTINAQNGPMYNQGGLGTAATSIPLAEQNWNAAFGSLYLANVNWNIYTFGKLASKENIEIADTEVHQADLHQEIFQHQIKTAAAYFNLLVSQRLEKVQHENHTRSEVIYTIAKARAESGLIPEVDASLAKAEMSSAQTATINANDHVLDYNKKLADLLVEDFTDYQLDHYFSSNTPSLTQETASSSEIHPSILFLAQKMNKSRKQEDHLHTLKLPSLSLFGVFQGRGSGFGWNYVQDNAAFSSSYLKGIGVDRMNYIVGLNLSWNLTDFYRTSFKVHEQKLITKALDFDYQQLQQELSNQQSLSESKYKNALIKVKESRIQMQAATDAFQQQKALYENGLTTIVDFTQALYLLNRAEINYEIAQNNSWQAVILIAASKGDISIITKAITH